jgi:hypothetical protein
MGVFETIALTFVASPLHLHSVCQADCSEGFYKAEFMDALKTKVADPKERQQMASMLQQFESAQAVEAVADDDEAEGAHADLLTRIRGLDLDDETQTEKVLAALTAAERAQFADRRYLASLLVQWNPWWPDDSTEAWAAVTANPSGSLVEELGGDEEDGDGGGEGIGADGVDGVNVDNDQLLDHGSLSASAGAARRERAPAPNLVENVTPLGQLLRGKQPAKELIFNLLDLIYCYAYTCRRYNGDVDQSWTECAEGLLAISPVMGADATHSSVEIAVHTTIAKVQDVETMFVSAWASARVIQDVAAIIREKVDVVRALSHMHQIIARKCSSKVGPHAGPTHDFTVYRRHPATDLYPSSCHRHPW